MDNTVSPGLSPTEDIRPHDLRVLDALFAPKTVAVIGGTESEGIERMVLSNLANYRFGGTVFPIFPKQKSFLGVKAYPMIAATPEPVDLAVIVSPAPAVPRIIGECVAAGVKGAIIISAGFRESGPAGAQLEREIMAQDRQGPLRIVGPN